MEKHTPVSISKQALQRMPYYLQALRAARDSGAEIISAPTVAAQLGLNEVQVRKDFAAVNDTAGKPKTGFQTNELIAAIERTLGYDNSNDAVLVGAGSLGRALLSYRGFEAYGLSIVAAFDVDPNLSGGEISGKQVLPMNKLSSICRNMNILELGCGSGTFWTVNQDKLPPDINVTITDISEGMIRDAKRNITNSGLAQYNFSYNTTDCCNIPAGRS